MKTLVSMLTAALLLTACGTPTDNPDGGKPSTLTFQAGTLLVLQNPADDADTATPGFQYDVVVAPRVGGEASGTVVFKLNDVTKATSSFEKGKATGRLTFNTGTAGTNTENLVTVERSTGDDTSIAWLFTVHNN